MIPKSLIKIWILRDLFGPGYVADSLVNGAFARLSDESLASAYGLMVVRPGWFA